MPFLWIHGRHIERELGAISQGTHIPYAVEFQIKWLSRQAMGSSLLHTVEHSPSAFTSPKWLQHFGAFACRNCYRLENKYTFDSCVALPVHISIRINNKKSTQPEAIQTRISLSPYTKTTAHTNSSANDTKKCVTLFYFVVWSLFTLFLECFVASIQLGQIPRDSFSNRKINRNV